MVLALANVVILLLHHGIEFCLLVGSEQLADLGDGAGAQGMDFVHLIVAGHGIVLDDGHRLVMLIRQDGFYFGLLIWLEVQLVRKCLDLVINI